MGRPKALVTDSDGVPWLRRAANDLHAAGLTQVIVVLGAAREEARSLVPDFAVVVDAVDWSEGMGASLRAGLTAATRLVSAADAAVIHLVDLPDVRADVIARLAGLAAPAALVRASYGGRIGHPVLIGRDHWAGVIASVHGDHGARDYLSMHDVTMVECGDLATGMDVDTAQR
jgi:molybdenum cofactor cytidylyltransferase/nicotine blue oxidoreductase